jgi:hypothetical protein
VECDGPVVALWAEKLAPFCDQTPAVCEQWLEGFLTAIRLARCEAMPEEVRTCQHAPGFVTDCLFCAMVLAKREGHTEAGVYWTAGEVIERMARR